MVVLWIALSLGLQGTSEGNARVDAPSQPALEGLRLETEVPVLAAPAGSESPVAGRVTGIFTQRDERLLIDGKQVAGGNAGPRFSILVPLVGEKTELQLTSIDPRGQVRGQTVVVDFPDFYKFRPDLSAHKRWRLGLGTGVHRLDYRQTSFNDVSVVSLPVVFHGLYEFNPNQLRWSAHVDGFISAASLLNTSTASVRDLRVSGRVAYGFRPGGKQWRIQPQVGGVLRSMLVTPDEFGFYRSIGVEISPSISYATESAGFFHLMPRYVFVFSGIRDGEWAMRLRWTYAVRRGLVMFLAGEYASFWATTSTAAGTTSGSLWSRQWLFWGGIQI